MFDRYGRYEADPDAIVSMLEDAVNGMHARAACLAGRRRDHTPTYEDPFTVIFVDEVAFLTAYQPDRKLRERTLAALATLTTQGRAVGYCVIAVLQDPRQDVLTIRNLFPDRIAMRLDEPDQVGRCSRARAAAERARRASLVFRQPRPAHSRLVSVVTVVSPWCPLRRCRRRCQSRRLVRSARMVVSSGGFRWRSGRGNRACEPTDGGLGSPGGGGRRSRGRRR